MYIHIYISFKINIYVYLYDIYVNTRVWDCLKNVINHNFISPSCHRRNKNPSGVECGGRTSSCHLYIVWSLPSCPDAFLILTLSFLWEAATEIAFKTTAIHPESNDTERHKQRVFSIHGLTCPYSIYLASAANITKIRNASTGERLVSSVQLLSER